MQRAGKLRELGMINRHLHVCRYFIASAEGRLARDRGAYGEALARETLATFNASLTVLLRVRGIVRREVKEDMRSKIG
jgi:hypothetical protein